MKSELITKFESPLPNVLDKDSMCYDADKIVTNGLFYLFDKKEVYVKSSLILFQKEIDEQLEWLVWAKMPAKYFVELSENISGEKACFKANLISEILFYDNTKGIEVNLEFALKEKNHSPKIIILNNNDELYAHYINGIDMEKFSMIQRQLTI